MRFFARARVPIVVIGYAAVLVLLFFLSAGSSGVFVYQGF
jgi:hypothetical protein